MKSSTYTHEASQPDYRHESHAGNIGDVWKHCVLASILSELTQGSRPLVAIDTHAGDGLFKLKPVGEWNGAIEKLLKLDKHLRDEPLNRYLTLVERYLDLNEREKHYPGSPLLISHQLREGDKLIASEIAPDVIEKLEDVISHDKRVTIIPSDGLAMLGQNISSSLKENQILVHIDPPWNSKKDWQVIPKAAIDLLKAFPNISFALWYPIKSYTRVNQMRREFSKARVKAVAAELITTPLEIQRNRLNGSGMILVNVPDTLLQKLAGSAVIMGRCCASHDGYFQSSITGL